MSDKPLKGRVAWVTGSARGIGKSIARKLAELGCDLALSDVLQDEVAATASELSNATGCKAIHALLDVTNRDGAAALVQRISDELGGLTILINNAGITRDGLLMRMSESDWDRVISVNLKGTFVCAQAAIKPMMKARYGKIINIASVVGVMGNAGQANYSASKAGIIGFTKSVAKELAGRGIRSNAIAPGFIKTEMTHELAPEVQETYLKAIPLGYLGSPEDIAQVCAFLSGAESDYLTGQVLVVDGGLHM